MNSKLAIGGFGCLLLAASFLWAAEVWEEKAYTEWSQREVQKVFQDSPWARQVRILSGGFDFERPGPPRPPSGQQGGPTIPGAGDEPAGPDADISQRREARKVFLVQWASSLTIRQARVRLAQIQGRDVTEQQIEQYLSTTPASYEIAVFGPDMQPFEATSEEAVKKSATLKLKESDREIPAAQVSYQRQGDRLVAVQLFFPREQDGDSLITQEEEKVRFSCDSSGATISTEFDLDKMTRDGELDI
ncbi:MAG: hypothetical protein GWN58_39940 [Anaerolineae bacterium]|nr:hypothetical protein [Anaerolineae bacterium]